MHTLARRERGGGEGSSGQSSDKRRPGSTARRGCLSSALPCGAKQYLSVIMAFVARKGGGMAIKDWFLNPDKRDTLKMAGGAVAALVAAGWAYHTWQPSRPGEDKPAQPVAAPQPSLPAPAIVIQAPVADHGGIATAINGNHNQVNVGKGGGR